MKKLTKVLSLVLVIAMVVSLCVVGVSAKTFTDTDKITADYTEAVDVTSDLGIVKGMTETTFGSTGNFTRAQACTMIARATLGTNAAEAMAPGSVTFTDVPTTYWGYKYVEYCANAGLVAGVGNNKFAPDATLTGLQYAKILMAALGVDVSACVGANWAIETAKLYFKTGFSAVAASNAVITREAAAQMTYDALFYATDAKTGYAVYKDGASVGYYATQNEATTQAALLGALDGSATYTVSATAVTVDPGTCLAKTVFGVTKTVGTDDFGRPANIYTTVKAAQATAYGWAAATYNTIAKLIANTPVLTYTAAVTEAKLYADFGATAANGQMSVNVITDGKFNAAGDTVNYNDIVTTIGGNGTLTEVYKTGVNTANIVVVNTYVGSVSGVTAATALAKRNVTVAYDTNVPTNGFTSGAFVSDDLALNDVVLYTVAETADRIFKVETAAKAVPTTVTATSRTDTSFVAGSTTYAYNAKAVGAVSADDVTGAVAKSVYVDSYGYVIKVAGVQSVANYAVLLNAVPSTTLDGTTYAGRLLMTDGKTQDVTLAAEDDSKLAANTLVSYSVNAAGKYDLTQEDVLDKEGDNVITKGTVAMTLGGESTKANAATVFLVETVDAAGVSTYTAYTGIANVPSITSAAGAAYVNGSNGYAAVVYVDTAVLASAAVAATDVIFVDASSESASTVYGVGTVYTYNAIVNGKVDTIKSTQQVSADAIFVGGVKNATTGFYTKLVEMADNPATGIDYTATATGVTNEATMGLVKFDSTEYTYTDTTAVYFINAAGAISSVGAAGVTTDANYTVTYYTTNGVLSFAVITYGVAQET